MRGESGYSLYIKYIGDIYYKYNLRYSTLRPIMAGRSTEVI